MTEQFDRVEEHLYHFNILYCQMFHWISDISFDFHKIYPNFVDQSITHRRSIPVPPGLILHAFDPSDKLNILRHSHRCDPELFDISHVSRRKRDLFMTYIGVWNNSALVCGCYSCTLLWSIAWYLTSFYPKQGSMFGAFSLIWWYSCGVVCIDLYCVEQIKHPKHIARSTALIIWIYIALLYAYYLYSSDILFKLASSICFISRCLIMLADTCYCRHMSIDIINLEIN